MKLERILKNVLVILFLFAISSCGRIEIKNTEWCADQGELGATCFNTLNDNKRRVTPTLWDKERFGYLCTSPSDFAEIKKIIKKLCSKTKKCTDEDKKRIDVFFDQAQKSRKKSGV